MARGFKSIKSVFSPFPKLILITALLIVSSLQLVAGEDTESTILTAERIDSPIVIDGQPNEPPWEIARELVVAVKDGSMGLVKVELKALYDEENIYILATWPDPTESVYKGIWSINDTGWTSSEDEDRLSFIWNIDSSIRGFDIAGCGMICHGDRMHTNAPGEKGDLWDWKASRSNPPGYMDDMWISDRIIADYTHEAIDAAFNYDSGGPMYLENMNTLANGPRHFEPLPESEEDSRFIFQEEIASGEAVEISVDSNIRNNINVPAYILGPPSGSRGDVEAKGVWEEGRWNIEIKRRLNTGQEDDVHFDTSKTYRFGIAIMDNTGGFEAFGKGHSFLLGANTLEFGGKGSQEVVELSLVRDYLVTSKAYMARDQSGLALSTISDSLVVFNRVRDAVAEVDPDLFIRIRNHFVDSRRNPSIEKIDILIEEVDLLILTFQGKRNPPEAGFWLKVLVLWGKVQLYVFITLAFMVLIPIYRMLKIMKRSEFRYLSIFMVMVITPIFLEGGGRLGALLEVPLLENLSFTTSEYVTLMWAIAMFLALYIGRIGFNEMDNALKSLEFYSKELENKMRLLRESQAQLLKSERLASIGQLAASMAHELRNPLGVIKNVSYFINMDIKKPDEKVKKHLSILDRELAASNKIITDLLDFSTGKPPNLKKIDLNSIMKEAISRSHIPENIRVDLKLEKRIPRIMVDKDQIRRVFYNIVMNAVQAMPDGGILKITSHLEDSMEIVQFIDTGVGLKDDETSKIFEPLYTKKAKGIGLGLALSKQIIKMHGGSIEAHNNEGKGATFTVRLPTSDSEKN